MPTTYGLPKKKEEVMEVLLTAFTEENLDALEYDRRMEQAMEAESIEALEQIIADFPLEIRRRIFPSTATTTTTRRSATSAALPALPPLRVVMGESYQHLSEINKQPLALFAALSTQKIDLRDAVLLSDELVIKVECILSETVIDLRNEQLNGRRIRFVVHGALGEIKILLPPGGLIEQAVDLIGGSLSVKDKRKGWLKRLRGQSPDPLEHLYTVIVQGNFWFGSIRIVYDGLMP